jgi:threonine synthase
VIRRDEVIVVNCSGHTFPVEKHLLGDEWARTVEMPPELKEQEAERRAVEEGLLGSLEQLDERVRSIAILEDDPQARLLLRRILQTRGEYRIFEASDGASGLEMVYRERPDLILLDLMMPEMDGFEVLEALKAE